MLLKEIIAALESEAPRDLQESYDNAGLITGNPSREIRKALLCIDSTEEVVKEAIRKKCELIIAHHPIVFSGLKRFTGVTYVERAVILAIRHDIAIYCMHTNLDNAFTGVNRKICEKLGLADVHILSPKKHLLKKLITFCPVQDAEQVRNALFAAGAGWIGDYSETSFNSEGLGSFKGGDSTNPYVGQKGKRHYEPEVRIETIYPFYLENTIVQALLKAHPYEEVAYDLVPLDNVHNRIGAGMYGTLPKPLEEGIFLKRVKKIFNARCIRHTRLTGKMVSKVAVCGGAGSFLLPDAIRAGADVFISADFKYHNFFDAEDRILIADIGHYESEQFTTEVFADILRKKCGNFALLFSDINTNPINYL
ncbi:MAG: GTP cyclohydrolase 1 type 2 [Chitinophagales bacterium]|nr:MAG: GTP cyclohydrolase 1 type 2 [Chitinophagales bacterium]